MKRNHLKKELTKILKPFNFKDYGPNGLQIEGSIEVEKIAFAVSATKDSIAKAIELKADALIVHHGLFWKFHGPKTITDAFYHRVAPLIKNDINLFGYHLPLDANLEIGNAASLGKLFKLANIEEFGDHKGCPTGVKGTISPLSATQFKQQLETILDHQVLHSSPNDNDMISKIGIVTGGANSSWLLAKQQGLDAFITGEMSEHDWNEAKESNLHYYAGGHHATEKFGIQALMNLLSETYPSVEMSFIDSSNPA